MPLKCFLGQVGKIGLAPSFPLNFQGKLVERHFREASENEISLELDMSKWNDVEVPERSSVDATRLHGKLGRLTNNPIRPGRVNKVGVIFAPRYKPRGDVYGVMFDRGVAQPDDPLNVRANHDIPREGCAIFLNTIADEIVNAGTSGRVEYQNEITYAVIHELGHVFNLVHNNDDRNFMHGSKTASDHDGSTVSFIKKDVSHLSRFASDPEVYPGGSGFTDIVPFLGADLGSRAASPALVGMDLSIGMTPREFWRFEPVELDVRVSVAPEVRRTFRVPDRVDPGYAEFTIWIDEPDGERRRYAAERHYCSGRSMLVISPGRPFVRDISIFLEQGSFTFRKTGIHRITAVFSLGKRGELVSTPLDVNVLPFDRRDGAQREIHEILLGNGVPRFLYHRRGSPRGRLLRQLLDFSTSRKCRTSMAIAYAIGRSLIASSEDTESTTTRRRLARRGSELLQVAKDSGLLGLNRMRLCQKIGEEIE